MSEPVSIRPRPWYRIENAAADAADIYIYDEIGMWGTSASDFVAELVGVNASTINLHLNTPGGDVFDGVAIYNALRNHPATVNTYIESLAASIGTVIAMGSDRVVIAPYARMMIHEAHIIVVRPMNAAEMTKMAERLEATSENIAQIYAERTEQDADFWRDAMREETWYTDQQAVDAGLADEVGRSNDELADHLAARMVARLDLSEYRHGAREIAALRSDLGVEENAGRPMSQSNLSQLHTAIDTLGVLHGGVCDDEGCTFSAKAEPEIEHIGGDPPGEQIQLSRIDARRRAVDEILEAVNA